MLNIETTKDYGFKLKFVDDMTETYSQIHCKDKYSHLSSNIWWLWSIGCVYVYEQYDSGFKTNCSYLNFRFRSCLVQRDAQHSDN